MVAVTGGVNFLTLDVFAVSWVINAFPWTRF